MSTPVDDLPGDAGSAKAASTSQPPAVASVSTEPTADTLHSSPLLSEHSATFGLSDAGCELPDPLIGLSLGDVVIERFIAEGGMGRVYLGRQQRPARPVAVKFMRYGRSRNAVERFRRESDFLGRLTHPGIAQVYTAGSVRVGLDDVPYSVMEFVPDARSLVTYASQQQLSLEQKLRLFLDVCDAVAYGHAHGVVHRDLKPGNLLVTPPPRAARGESGSTTADPVEHAAGRVRVIDFGIAKLLSSESESEEVTATGEYLGTRQYMSPEQLTGGRLPVDARSDVYSLGVVLHELLTGRLPYDLAGRSIAETARLVSEQRPRPLEIDDPTAARVIVSGLRQLAATCLEKEPADRYPSAAELAEDLRGLLAGVAVPRRIPQRIAQRKRWLAGALAVIAAVVLVGGVMARQRPQPDIAAMPASASVSKETSVDQAASRPEPAAGAPSADLGPLIVSFSPIQAARTTPVEWVHLSCRSQVDELDLSDFSLTRDGQPVDLSSAELVQENPVVWKLGRLGPLNEQQAEYVLTLGVPSDLPVDVAGRRLAEPVVARWTMPPYQAWKIFPDNETWKQHLVSIDGLECYTEQDAGGATFFRPTEPGVEGSIVFRFETPFEIDAALLYAFMAVWTTGDPYPYDPGAKASLDVSRDGQAWTTLKVLEAGSGGYHLATTDIAPIVKGSREVWVRGRLEATVAWPGDGLIHAQFLRTNQESFPPLYLQAAGSMEEREGSAPSIPVAR